jgi:hypothetical protein
MKASFFFYLGFFFVLTAILFTFYIFPPSDETQGSKHVTLTTRIVFIIKNICFFCINLICSANETQRHSPSLRKERCIFFRTYFSENQIRSHFEPYFTAMYHAQSPCSLLLFRSAFVYLRAKGEVWGSGYYVATVLHVACLPSLFIPSSASKYNDGWTRKTVG